MKRIFCLLLAVAFLGAGPASARAWTKDHTTIHDPDRGVVVEYTSIRSDTELPFVSRQLVRVYGHLLVIRTVMHDEDGSYTRSIESLATGEILSIEADFEQEIRLTLGDQTIRVGYREFADSFQTSGKYPSTVRSEARSLLEFASKPFRGELRALAEVGRHHSVEFNPLTVTLMVFFDDLEFIDPGEQPRQTSKRVEDFHPQQHPPGPFEAAFGAAYFE